MYFLVHIKPFNASISIFDHFARPMRPHIHTSKLPISLATKEAKRVKVTSAFGMEVGGTTHWVLNLLVRVDLFMFKLTIKLIGHANDWGWKKRWADDFMASWLGQNVLQLHFLVGQKINAMYMSTDCHTPSRLVHVNFCVVFHSTFET